MPERAGACRASCSLNQASNRRPRTLWDLAQLTACCSTPWGLPGSWPRPPSPPPAAQQQQQSQRAATACGLPAMEIWGNATTFNLESVLRQNILGSDYYRGTCAKLATWSDVVDEVYNNVDHVEPWMSGNARGPSSAFCLLHRMFTMKLNAKEIKDMLDHADSPYIRAVSVAGRHGQAGRLRGQRVLRPSPHTRRHLTAASLSPAARPCARVLICHGLPLPACPPGGLPVPALRGRPQDALGLVFALRQGPGGG